jgi:hypothetical protein
MGGATTPARLTTAISGVDGDTLGAAGGDERLQQHQHGVALNTYFKQAQNDSGVPSRNYVTQEAGAAYAPNTENAGAGSGQNVQPTIVCNYIIFAGI